MERKGWSISETARQASQLLKDGGRLSRAHVWHYAQGKALPRTRYLQALSLALDVSFEELTQSAQANLGVASGLKCKVRT